MSPLIERIARRAREAQDTQLAALPMDAVRAQVAAESSAARGRPRAVWLVAAALAACGVLVSVRGLVPALTPHVTDEAAAPTMAAVLGYIAAPAAAPLVLTFAQGSRVWLGAGSALRVAQLDARGAHVHVERGEAQFDVVHRPGTRWRVDAGPFTTEVVGTRFDVRWEPDGRGFELAMHEGVVQLSGPGVGPGLRVSGSERVAVPARALRGEPAVAHAPSVTLLQSAPAQATPRFAPAAPPGKIPRKPLVAAERAFDALARAGRYAEAVASAQASGWDEAVATSSAGGLLRLADAARLARRADLARPVYLAVRTRFPGSLDAARAAFALGRLADARDPGAGTAAHGEAIGWFTRYLEEAPEGALRPEAFGRLLALALARGASAEARRWATELLAVQPDGPSSALARRVLHGAQ
jgi:FecR protein